MKSSKDICFITIILLLLFSLVGCSLLPSTTQPKGIISGQVLIPPNGVEFSKDITGWVPVANATVTVVDADGETHTVTTDENGYYSFENLAVSPNTVITAIVTVNGSTMILKSVVPQSVSSDQEYEAGEMTPDSTALALVIEALIASGENQSDIDLEAITSNDNFSNLLELVTAVLEAGGDVTEDAEIIDKVNDIVNPITPPESSSPTVINYNITSSSGEDGSIDPEGNITVEKGSSQTFTIIPDGGFKVADVLVDGTSVGAVLTYSFENVQQGHTIEAIFDCLTPESLTINIDRADGKVCIGSCVTVETVTVSFSDASEDLVISDLEDERLEWFVPVEATFTESTGNLCTPASAEADTIYKLEVTYTDKCANPVINGEVSVTTKTCYNLTLYANPDTGGTVSDLTDAGPYLSGAEVSISAVPNTGYAFANWTTTAAGTFSNANSTSTTFTIPAENAEVTAHFKSVLFAEDFTGLSYGETPYFWERTSSNWVGAVSENSAGGTAPEVSYAGSGDSSVTHRLISPLIDATGYSGLKLVFKYFVNDFSYYSNPYQLKVQVSTDNTATWTTKATYTFGTHYNDRQATVAEVNLSDYDGEEFLVAWVFDGDPSGIITWRIDDIVIFTD